MKTKKIPNGNSFPTRVEPLKIYAGDDHRFIFEFVNQLDSIVFDLTEWDDWRCEWVNESKESGTIAVDPIDLESGLVTLTIRSEIARTIGRARFDVQATHTESGDTRTFFTGHTEWKNDITTDTITENEEV